MATTGVWGIAAIALAGMSAGWLSWMAAQEWQRRTAIEAALAPEAREKLRLLAPKGVIPLRPLAMRMLRIPGVRAAADNATLLAEEQDVRTTPEALASLVLGAGMVAGFAAALVCLSPVLGLAVCALVLAGAYAFVKNAAEKRGMAMREQIPDALRCMGTCFRSGLSLPQTLQQTARECGGWLGRLFSVSARRLRMGETPQEALAVMRSDEQVPELSFVAIALDVQHQSGGSIAPVLETARESVISELDLMRSLRVQTAQAKLSASIVTVMPFVLVALFSLVSPDFLAPFFESLAGMALLALALIMQISGVLAVRRMLRIEAG